MTPFLLEPAVKQMCFLQSVCTTMRLKKKKKKMTVQIHFIEQTFLKPWIVTVEELDCFSSDVCLLACLVCFGFATKLI